MSKLPVITAPADQPGTLGILDPERLVTEIDTDRLREALSGLTGQIAEVLQDIRAVGHFRLTQVQVAVEISAEGGVALIGSAKAGAKGAIHLTFSV